MTWFRSRRFYLGLLIGLAPLVLIALLALVSPANDSADTQRVVVRNYSECIPDSLSAARTAGLLEVLPSDGILVETFPTCRGQGDRVSRIYPEPQAIGLTPVQPPAQNYDTPALPQETAAQADILSFSPIPPVGVLSAGGGLPGASTYPEPTRRRAWLAVLAAPFIGFVSLFDNDNPYPPDIICPDDSGIPTGEHRPRC